MFKRRTHLILWAVAGVAAIILLWQYGPLLFKPQAKPEPKIEKPVYEYYIVINEETGEVLTYVSTVQVSTGDEYVSADNKRYVVTRIEENRAYARNFGPADGGKDRGKFKDKTQ
jgi:hypothetical protein